MYETYRGINCVWSCSNHIMLSTRTNLNHHPLKSTDGCQNSTAYEPPVRDQSSTTDYSPVEHGEYVTIDVETGDYEKRYYQQGKYLQRCHVLKHPLQPTAVR